MPGKSDLLSSLNSMRQDGVLTDVILATSGGQHEVKAHKNVLAARSPYFYAMFTTGNIS